MISLLIDKKKNRTFPPSEDNTKVSFSELQIFPWLSLSYIFFLSVTTHRASRASVSCSVGMAIAPLEVTSWRSSGLFPATLKPPLPHHFFLLLLSYFFLKTRSVRELCPVLFLLGNKFGAQKSLSIDCHSFCHSSSGDYGDTGDRG